MREAPLHAAALVFGGQVDEERALLMFAAHHEDRSSPNPERLSVC